MDKESRIALIIAQAAMLNAEIAMAQAANKERDLKGLKIRSMPMMSQAQSI